MVLIQMLLFFGGRGEGARVVPVNVCGGGGGGEEREGCNTML